MAENYTTTGAIEVPFSDDEEVKDEELITDEDRSLKLTNPKAYQDRLEKRRERSRTREKERKEQAEALKVERAEKEELKLRLARLEGAVVATQRAAAPTTPGEDPYEKQLDAVYQKQNDAYLSAQAEIKAGTFDEKRAKHYEKIAREVDADKARIHVAKAEAARVPVQRQEQAQQVYVQKYPDVYNNPQAYRYAKATFERRIALGEQETTELLDEVMTETRTVLKMGGKPKPSATDRERMSGIPSSGGGGGGTQAPTGGIGMTPEFKKMATSLYSELPEKEALRKWVDGPGKELRKQKVI